MPRSESEGYIPARDLDREFRVYKRMRPQNTVHQEAACYASDRIPSSSTSDTRAIAGVFVITQIMLTVDL